MWQIPRVYMTILFNLVCTAEKLVTVAPFVNKHADYVVQWYHQCVMVLSSTLYQEVVNATILMRL